MACCAVAAYIIFRLVAVYDRLSEPLIPRQRPNGAGKPAYEPTPDRSGSPPATAAPVAGAASCILSLGGLVCGTCVQAVQTALRDQPGVSRARTSLTLLRAHVTYDPASTSPAALVDAVRDAGYRAEAVSGGGGGGGERGPWSELRSSFESSDAARLRDIAEWRRAFAASAVCSGLAVAASYAAPWSAGTVAQGAVYVAQLLAAVVSMLVSRRIHLESARSLWLGQRRNMSTLASLGICIGFTQSIFPLLADGLAPAVRGNEGSGPDGPCFDGICVLASVVLGGRLVKAVVSRRTLGSGASLAALIPLAVHVVGEFNGSGESAVPLDMVAPGDCILVCQGERIPVDGVVRRCVAGGTRVLESWMTGAVVPRRVEQGDFVYAGSLVSHGQLTITAKAIGTASRLGKTLERIAGLDAESNSPATTTESIAENLVDVILALAAATTLGLRLACGMPWALCLGRCTAMLLAACPCAFSLSVPSVLLASTSSASRAGVQLATSMERFKMAAHTRTVLFDKTGTLTRATLRVSCAIIADDWSDTVTRRLAWWTAIGALERHVIHPVAAAVVDESERQIRVIRDTLSSVVPEPALSVSAIDYIPARGIQGLVALPGSEPIHVAIGSLAFMRSISVAADLSAVPEHARSTIASTLVVAINHTYAGILVSDDAIRPTAKAAVAALKSRGINVGLLTGDTFSSASLAAKAVGIPVERIFADRLPDDKASVVRELRRLGPVMFVGDNLNDIPAFASSSFSVAVVSDPTHSPCGPGSIDALLSLIPQANKADYDGPGKVSSAPASDSVDLTRLPYLIDLATQAVKRVRLNLIWCALYNITALLLSSGALGIVHQRLVISPVMASFGMGLSSILVMLQSLTLNYECIVPQA